MNRELDLALMRYGAAERSKGYEDGYEAAVRSFRSSAASYWIPASQKPKVSNLYLVQCRMPNGGIWTTTASYGVKADEWLGATGEIEYWAYINSKLGRM